MMVPGLRGPPKGLLLFGPPGTGKTLIGKCIASQSGSTFFSISASSLTSKWVGEGEKMVRALFAVAKVSLLALSRQPDSYPGSPALGGIHRRDRLAVDCQVKTSSTSDILHLFPRSDSDHESSRKIKTEFLVQLDGANTVVGSDVVTPVFTSTSRGRRGCWWWELPTGLRIWTTLPGEGVLPPPAPP